ncbi:NADP-dependent malic enzyme [Candidatus Uhrbacteria bacterium]|nr:NADP-dependent malic enzyme [Candidatus Uhrbacteria bacterium]
MDYNKESLKRHAENKGKIELGLKVPLENRDDLSTYYTPGVAEPCREIAKDVQNVWKYTPRGNWVAVVTDGSSVLGLGNIGPEAAYPVMEGKAVLFKTFANVDAFPICLATQDVDEIVETVVRLAPSFGGINLEDIAAPRCFEIERRLRERLDIPVFHDDQHGTAIVTVAGLINALKVTNRTFDGLKVVMSGAGAAGTAIAKLLSSQGVADIVMCDSKGIISPDRDNLNGAKKDLLSFTNPNEKGGTLADALEGADVFIGVSVGGIVSSEMVKSMAKDAIVFAMANPDPEIMPQDALDAGAAVVASGRSDFPNQINNVLAFPGVFRGAFDAKAKEITEDMKLAAAQALAGVVKEPHPTNIIPDAFDPMVVKSVSSAVARVAKK